MRIQKWKPYVVCIVLTEAVGALSGFLTREGTKTYEAFAAKPALTPPGAVFPVVWSVLYALMGIGAARIWKSPAPPGSPVPGILQARTLEWVAISFSNA